MSGTVIAAGIIMVQQEPRLTRHSVVIMIAIVTVSCDLGIDAEGRCPLALVKSVVCDAGRYDYSQ
eukprot:scaffold9522_cov33-Prasinocladus_malaysianus.AAC.1